VRNIFSRIYITIAQEIRGYNDFHPIFIQNQEEYGTKNAEFDADVESVFRT
jgi:hypothetical protein